jgi:hypothetical protein
VAAVRAGHVKIHPDGHIMLPETLCWPFATNNVLYMRTFYRPLFDHVLNMCQPVKPGMQEASQRRIVTGQPGIGKSVWT